VNGGSSHSEISWVGALFAFIKITPLQKLRIAETELELAAGGEVDRRKTQQRIAGGKRMRERLLGCV